MKFDLGQKPIDINLSKDGCLAKAKLWLRSAENKEGNKRTIEDIDSSLDKAAEYEQMAFDGRG